VSFFQREHITALTWWSVVIAIALGAYLIVTAIIASTFYGVRWVVRGFIHEEQ
jgi:hypothetical protein